MSMTAVSPNTPFRRQLGLAPDCSIDRCFRASLVTLTQTHPLWASPLRIDVCATHQRTLTREAEAAGVTVTIDRRGI
jgi:hypothetical protein